MEAMMRVLSVLGLAAVLAASAGVAGAQKEKEKKDKTTHVTVCPMTGKDSKDSTNTEKYGKYTIHFCCDKCQAPFDKLSKKEKDAKIKAALKKPEPKKAAESADKLTVLNVCPITGEKVIGEGGGKSVVGKYEVHFCCGGCKPQFDALSPSEKDAK